MKIRWVLVALLSAALAVAAACGDDEKDNPFKGAWIAETGASIVFTGDTWSDSGGDAGTYSFTGEYPLYTLTMQSGSAQLLRRATFTNANAFELCVLSASGTLGECVDLVIDKPTLH